jgi:hypothetical protein
VTATADGRHPLTESSGPAEVGLSPGSVAGAGLAAGGPVLPEPVLSLPVLAGLTALELDESGLDDGPGLAGTVLAEGGLAGAVLGGLAGAVLAGGGLGLEDLGLGLAAGLAHDVGLGLAPLALADVEPGGLGLELGLGTGAVLA